MYQNCLRQQPSAATYITSPNGATGGPPPTLYDRGPYCYPSTSPTNPQSVVYQGSVYSQTNGGHLSELTSSHCLAANKPPVPGLTDASNPAPTSPAGALYWPHYHQHQRGSYPVAPAGSTPPTTYYDHSRRVMSPAGAQWPAVPDVQFGGHSTVSDGQPSIEGYSAYGASVRDLGYTRPAAAGGERRGGGGEDVLPQQPRQHPSYVLPSSHQTSLKAGSRPGPEYHRSTLAGAQRVSTGSSAGSQGHAAPPFDWMRKHAYPSVPSSGKTRTKDKYRIVYTEVQKVELEKEFLYNQYITIQRKAELAVAIGLSDRQVKIWFQNRRAKDRKQKRKRSDIHHQQQQQQQHPTTVAPSTKTTSSSSASAAGPTTHSNNNTSRLSSSSSPSSSSSSSSSSSLVLKQEMMMRCEDAVKLESSFVDSIGRSSVASGNNAYDVIPIC